MKKVFLTVFFIAGILGCSLNKSSGNTSNQPFQGSDNVAGAVITPVPTPIVEVVTVTVTPTPIPGVGSATTFSDLVLTGMRMSDPYSYCGNNNSSSTPCTMTLVINNGVGVSQTVSWPYSGGTVTVPQICIAGAATLFTVQIQLQSTYYGCNQALTYVPSTISGSFPYCEYTGGVTPSNHPWAIIGARNGTDVYMGFEMHGGGEWDEVDDAIVKFSCAGSTSLDIANLCHDSSVDRNLTNITDWYSNNTSAWYSNNSGSIPAVTCVP